MACTYVDAHPGSVDALALLAAYATSGDNISGESLSVVSLVGTNDTVVNRANMDSGKAYLPASTVYVTIQGGNHAQFGSYGPQPGDSPATIPPQRQRAETVDAVVKLLAP